MKASWMEAPAGRMPAEVDPKSGYALGTLSLTRS